jgi:LacI family transcriptional regulator, galactose operon repressor
MRSLPERITLRDVARAAGVSVGAASMALNGSAAIAPATRGRVEAAAQALNYRPNVHARRLIRRRHETLGIVFTGPEGHIASHFFYGPVLTGVLEAAEECGYAALVARPTWRADRLILPHQLRSDQIDGLLAFGGVVDDLLAETARRGVPRVLIDNHLSHPDVPAVDNDDRGGAYLGTRHLLALGHRRVGYLGAKPFDPLDVEARAGYAQALAEADLPVAPDDCVSVSYTLEGGIAAMERMLEQPSPPRAFFAATDAVAVGAMRVLGERGRRVPDDVAIVGMDDVDLARYTQPPLTTVHIEREQMGREAVRRLIDLIEGRDGGPVKTVIPTRLVIRGSCGAAGARPAARR